MASIYSKREEVAAPNKRGYNPLAKGLGSTYQGVGSVNGGMNVHERSKLSTKYLLPEASRFN